MNISLCSDLHLDISGHLEMPGGDILILAGDVCEARELSKEFRETKLVDRKPGTYPCHDFFEFECAKYKKVFYVLGNHEHYRGRLDKTRDMLEQIMPANVTILEDEVVEYEGVMFMGATLWTDMNKGDPITVHSMKSFMNDYIVIQNFYPAKSLYHKLTPEHTVAIHRKTKQYFKTVLEMNRDKPFVVITHMAPSYMSINEKYKHETTSNGAYASDMSEFILDNENIKVWCHGHMHDPVNYYIGTTRIISNPRGYLPWESGNGFDPNFIIEV